MKIIVTGCAGFIGMHVTEKLLAQGFDVAGLDNINDYYDVSLKFKRLKHLQENNNKFAFFKVDISSKEELNNIFYKFRPEIVINLAAQAGVRYSIENPDAYINSNMIGFFNVIEACRNFGVKHLVYASSSSVYGGNKKTPFSVIDRVDSPVSLYAATKKANELIAYSYSHLYGFATTGLRYFTVYGPWGRPDMAPWLFTESMRKKEAINIFNKGEMRRDFTYIDDVVDGTICVLNRDLKDNYKIYNIGSSNPINLMDFIQALEGKLRIVAQKVFLEMQPGDVVDTFADMTPMQAEFGFEAKTSLQEGVGKWVEWYEEYEK